MTTKNKVEITNMVDKVKELKARTMHGNISLLDEVINELREQQHTIDFVKRWILRLLDEETTLDEFLAVASFHPSFKELRDVRKKR